MADAKSQKNNEFGFSEALEKVVKAALLKDQIARDLNEVCKAIDDKEKPALCILAEDSREDRSIKLIKGLCKEKSVPLVRIPEGLELGRWIGHYKYDEKLNQKKAKRVPSIVLKNLDFEDEDAVKLIQERINLTYEIIL